MSLPPFPHTASSPRQPERLQGFVLHRDHDGQDKDLGELEEVIELGRGLYYVVDARHWSFGTRKLVPVGVVVAVDLARLQAWTEIDLDLIRRSPDFDPFLLSSGHYADRVTDYWAGAAPVGAAPSPGPSPTVRRPAPAEAPTEREA